MGKSNRRRGIFVAVSQANLRRLAREEALIMLSLINAVVHRKNDRAAAGIYGGNRFPEAVSERVLTRCQSMTAGISATRVLLR